MLWWIILENIVLIHLSTLAILPSNSHLQPQNCVNRYRFFLLILIYFLHTPLHGLAFYSFIYPVCLFLSYLKHAFVYVTGFWKTDRIVTLGLFHFIGPANGYTHTLHIHTAIIRLGWLVCFSRATFADPVNSWVGQWDPWRALHGRHGCEIHHRDRGTSITPFKRVWAYGWHFWDS